MFRWSLGALSAFFPAETRANWHSAEALGTEMFGTSSRVLNSVSVPILHQINRFLTCHLAKLALASRVP